MRILTVRQPWAWAITAGYKDVENRVRNIAGDYRGPVLIHTSKRLPPFQEHWDAGTRIAGITGKRPLFHDPSSMGAIIGVVDLVDVHRSEGNKDGIVADMIRDRDPYALNGSCSPWAEANVYHLVFANPRALDEPIPWRGGLGLRKVPQFDVVGDWLVEASDRCSCGGGPYQHEPACGWEPVAQLIPAGVTA